MKIIKRNISELSYTSFVVNNPTVYGDTKPGTTIITPTNPIKMPEKLGLRSTRLANGPVVIDPLNVIDNTKNIITANELLPAYAIPIRNAADPMLHTKAANLRIFVRVILFVRIK